MIRILQMGMIFMYSLYVGLTALGKESLLSSLFQIDTLNNRFAVGITVQRRLSEDSPSLRSLRARAWNNDFSCGSAADVGRVEKES